MTFSSPTFAPIFRTEGIRELEVRALAGLQSPGLMERAGLAAALLARDLTASGGCVLIVAGPGNNGGDAFVVARHLKSWWYEIVLVFAGSVEKLPAAARAAYDAWRDCGGTTLDSIPQEKRWDLVVDGLFGIGLKRDIGGSHAQLMATINGLDVPVLALDVPSGIDSDTGAVRGHALHATHTATFIALKPGLLTLDGTDHCGEIRVCTLDLDASRLLAPQGAVIGSDILQTVLPRRRANSHKGSYGSIGVVGGASGMVGAALLAGRAALHLGAGRVYAGLLNTDSPGVDTLQPELMLRTVKEVLDLEHLNCIAIGPGLGISPAASDALDAALRKNLPLVIDADALNLVSANSGLQRLLTARSTSTVLTPHPAEAARLLGESTSAVQADRVRAATEMAQRFRSLVVLKGAGSICALPDGSWFINTRGNPGMASAGMGDVLTGMIAALLAQGADPQAAMLAAVYLHAAAADELVAAGIGPTGMTASEVYAAARRLINRESMREPLQEIRK